jgi:HNH endonuclease/AP2 domain
VTSLHRVIYEYYHGSIPKGFEIDHINQDKLDNRLENLRLATRSQNSQNKSKQKNNTSGFKGAYWHKENKKWNAAITVNNKLIHLGFFETPELAHETYKQAAIELHGEFAKY